MISTEQLIALAAALATASPEQFKLDRDRLLSSPRMPLELLRAMHPTQHTDPNLSSAWYNVIINATALLVEQECARDPDFARKIGELIALVLREQGQPSAPASPASPASPPPHISSA